jgi:GTP-binding protein YchF
LHHRPKRRYRQSSDPRLNKISEISKSKVTVPTTVEFVDIAGLVKGASKGEGLGNQFLTHIKQVNAICHILRCFEDENIIHVGGKVNPLDDKEIIDMELCLADLDVVDKNLTKNEKLLKSGDKTIPVKVAALKKIKPLLEQGKSARHADLTEEEKFKVQDLHLMTIKPVLYVCNVNEADVVNGNDMVRKLKKWPKPKVPKSSWFLHASNLKSQK